MPAKGFRLSPSGAPGNAVGAVTSVSNLDGTLTAFPITGDTIVSRAAITGDVAIAGGSNVSVLATVNANVGSFGSSTAIPSFTVNGKGLITAASANVVVAPAGTLTGTTLNSTVATSSLTTVGTLINLTVTNAPTFSAMTAKSVLFAGTAGLLSQDNANFSYDSSSHSLYFGFSSLPSFAYPDLGPYSVNINGNLSYDNGFLVKTAGNSSMRMFCLEGIVDWSAWSQNAVFSLANNAYLLDDTSIYGSFLKMDMRNASYGNRLTLYGVPPHSNPVPQANVITVFTAAVDTGQLLIYSTNQSPIFGTSQLEVNSSTTSMVTTAFVAIASQTADILQMRKNDGTVYTSYNATGLLGKYNSVATAGWGVPAVYGNGRSTAQTAAVASVATYTVGAADGSFLVTANVNVTTSTAHSFTVTCSYTDETNTARTLTLSFIQVGGGTPIATITNVTGAGPYEGVPNHIRCKAGTAVTLATTGTFTTVTYNVEGSIIQIA